jgi:hypothetical protein
MTFCFSGWSLSPVFLWLRHKNVTRFLPRFAQSGDATGRAGRGCTGIEQPLQGYPIDPLATLHQCANLRF